MKIDTVKAHNSFVYFNVEDEYWIQHDRTLTITACMITSSSTGRIKKRIGIEHFTVRGRSFPSQNYNDMPQLDVVPLAVEEPGIWKRDNIHPIPITYIDPAKTGSTSG